MTTSFYAGPLTTLKGSGNYEGPVVPPLPSGTTTAPPGTSPLGKGTMWFNDGRSYEGNWSARTFHGTGALRTARFEYIGDFSKGKITGQGTMSYIRNGVYEGWFLNDKREGRGTMKWNSGITYTGEWKDDKIKGFGKVTWPNGDWWEANWDGSFNDIWEGKGQQGKGRACWHQKSNGGKVYVGATKGGLRHGFGTLTTTEYKFEGNFTNGNRDGRFKVTKLATKKITHRKYKDDEWVDD
jgi:hypothetical protein